MVGSWLKLKTREELMSIAKEEYKLFEIEWDVMPRINDCWPVVAGQLHDGYRIFGFTDDQLWQPGARQTEWHPAPCDFIGNRKYAIGRREE